MSDDTVNMEVDGEPVEARKGEMVIEVTDRIGSYIPRFCYHDKLSVAANCRMCLVEIEKAPKPMPACATPVGEGMKVFTRSPGAIAAQKATMEFLLINHPLDCPICDQGGECELQDLAMGYGRDVSRYNDGKRVVPLDLDPKETDPRSDPEHRHAGCLARYDRVHARLAVPIASWLDPPCERLRSDVVDLIQLHNLVDEAGWEEAFAPGGAVEALAEERERGHVRFLGVTGHGTRAAEMHLRSLERFPFDSVLIPYNFTMLAQPEYAASFDELVATCRERGVAVQTIKSIARRRWQDESARRFSWYEPVRDADAIRRAVHFVLARPGLFLNSSSDATLLRSILEAAAEVGEAPAREALEARQELPPFVQEPAEEEEGRVGEQHLPVRQEADARVDGALGHRPTGGDAEQREREQAPR